MTMYINSNILTDILMKNVAESKRPLFQAKINSLLEVTSNTVAHAATRYPDAGFCRIFISISTEAYRNYDNSENYLKSIAIIA